MDKDMIKQKKNERQKSGRLVLLPVILFVGVLFVCMLVSIVKPKSDFSEAENRALQELPELSFDGILQGDVQEEYEDYLSDQFWGREGFVALCSKLKRSFGKKDINGVYLGTDGYLLEKYHASDFDKTQVEDNIFYLSAFIKDTVKSLGKDHVRTLFIPSKATVLSSYMPEHAKAYDTSYVPQQVAKEISFGVEEEEADVDGGVLNLTMALNRHEKEYIYYRTDHHWTTLGAYYAYSAYKESLGQRPPALSDYKQKVVSNQFLGTSYDKVQQAEQADEIRCFTYMGTRTVSSNALHINFDDGASVWDSYYDENSLSTKDKYSYFLGGNTAKIHITTGTDNGKVLLLLKDSFSNSFVEFLEQDYTHIYMLDLRYVEGNVYDSIAAINRENSITDVLVLYNVEKFMQDDNMWKLEQGHN